MAVHNCTIFMQDGAPCHRSKVAKTFLAENRIKVLDWPGNSPDFNPIENLWTNMKNKVAEKHPSSVKDLVKVIKEVWVKKNLPRILQKSCSQYATAPKSSNKKRRVVHKILTFGSKYR